MKHTLVSRRIAVAFLSIICLTAIAFINKVDVTMAIASIAIAVAGSNALEGSVAKLRRKEGEDGAK